MPLSLQEGYHVNSNHPPDEYLIPLRLTWSKGALEPAEVVYPKPAQYKIQSEPKPLSVYSGNFELIAKFNVPADRRYRSDRHERQAALSGVQ